MPIECRQTTQGGKGNLEKFLERDPNVVAAGLATTQQHDNVEDSLQHYLLKDHADALIHDAIIPLPKERPLPPLRKLIPQDMRHAGPFGHAAQLLNPRILTKFENLVAECKDTVYPSYWKKVLGRVPDPVPMFPEGFDIFGTTFGQPTQYHGRLYDIIMPKNPPPDNTLPSKEASAQVKRNYCEPPFNPDLTYGHRTFADKDGRYARCCLTNDRKTIGLGKVAVMNSVQSNFLDAKQPTLGGVLAPNNNITEVPQGYTFGQLEPPDNFLECLSGCEINEGVEFFRRCLKHLNTVRRGLVTRVLPTFFNKFYLTLKYHDTKQTGWLPKEVVYKECGIKLIRFDPTLIEPLLSMWQAFDGSRIEYKKFVRIINFREPSPEIPKIPDYKPECLNYETTYKEMVKPGQVSDNRLRAGLPSGRYLDLDFPIIPEEYCAADKSCLSHEADMKSCISPSVLTNLFVKHREMYQKQTPENVRRVFEASGEHFSDNRFKAIWDEAQKLHSQGWVCYETFRRTLENHPDPAKFDE